MTSPEGKLTLATNLASFFNISNLSVWLNGRPKHSTSKSQTEQFRQLKSLTWIQSTEICFLVLIFIEHTFIFILTFQKQVTRKSRKESNPQTIVLPAKSFLYHCLHRNWIRALAFSNISLAIVYLLILIIKHHNPNLLHHLSITFYSLPLRLLQQLLINFNTFHLFIISISVFQYFLRYYRLIKNAYPNYYFNERNRLLIKNTNVALILSGSLALIFAYNFIFYTPKYPQTMSLLPLITFNMILLPLINLIMFSLFVTCLILIYCYRSHSNRCSLNNTEPEDLRSIVEKNTCIKCYSEILENNDSLFPDNDYSYRSLYNNFFSTTVRSSYPFQIKRSCSSEEKRKNYSQTSLSYEQRNDVESNPTTTLFFQSTVAKLNHQHSLCHMCYYLLLIFLFKYVLLTCPQYILQMLFHLKQFYEFILKDSSPKNFTFPLYDENEVFLTICHFLFLLSRFGDSLLLIRLPHLIKSYFPCWCQFNSKFLSEQKPPHHMLTVRPSDSSHNESISAGDATNPTDLPKETKQQVLINNPHCRTKHRRFRLRFQFVPLWSNDRPRLFKKNTETF